MSISQEMSVDEVLREHVTLDLGCIDRMYLNVYVPQLQRPLGAVGFFKYHRGKPFVSSALMGPMTDRFVRNINSYVRAHDIPVVKFEQGQRKDEIAARYRASFEQREGVVFLGKAQEKASVFRTRRRRNPTTGDPYPWIVKAPAMVNHYYWYCQDEDFGPFFLKFCSYFPYTAKLCINGHEYAKRQAEKQGIDYEPLDNGIHHCADPQRLQEICDGLSGEHIRRLLDKWMKRLPLPFTQADRDAGYNYELSILQVEFSSTLILDRPLSGRILFEQIIRENLDLGRPSQVQLIFNRRVTKRTPGRFRTRVVTEGVTPCLHVDYKSSRIKQYHKEERGLRTETTINNPRDFGIGKGLKNLPELRKIGFEANRRLLSVQMLSHDCSLGEEEFQRLHNPRVVNGQRVSAFRFGDRRVQALLQTLVMFCHLPQGFANRDLRAPLAQLLGLPLSQMTQGRMTYDLRRLRLHGIIQRIPHTHRYRLTSSGLRVALFYTRFYQRLFRPGLTTAVAPQHPSLPPPDPALETALCRVDTLIANQCAAANLDPKT